MASTWEIRADTRREILAAHLAPCPEELVERAIKLLTYRRDLVIDPFNGSGTTTAVAKRLERRFIGIDRSPAYCSFASTRLEPTTPDVTQVIPKDDSTASPPTLNRDAA